VQVIAEALGVTGIDQGWEKIVDEAMHRAATGQNPPEGPAEGTEPPPKEGEPGANAAGLVANWSP
jgi:hypothetical protein